MRNLIPVVLLLFNVLRLSAQPYLDVAAVRYQYSPDAGIFRRSLQPDHLTYGNVGLNLPHVFKDSSVVVFSPLLERWDISSSALPKEPFIAKGITLQLAVIKTLPQHWSAAVVFLPRWNGETFSFKNAWLPAGVVLISHKVSDAFTYRLGVYVHHELYGTGVIPLGGLDWKVNNTLRLFGILPGSIVIEKKAAPAFYYGASFRGITASYLYHENGGGTPVRTDRFLRIDENEVQAFADYYLTKNIVLNAEVGHSVLRRFRTGIVNTHRQYELKEKFNDDVLFRVSVLYRVRFE